MDEILSENAEETNIQFYNARLKKNFLRINSSKYAKPLEDEEEGVDTS